jgi:cold shock CspA family protein
VETFDDARGIGTVVADDGSRFPFHCTAVTDGSRHVDAGADVVFEVVPGRVGRMEAVMLTPLGAPPG